MNRFEYPAGAPDPEPVPGFIHLRSATADHPCHLCAGTADLLTAIAASGVRICQAHGQFALPLLHAAGIAFRSTVEAQATHVLEQALAKPASADGGDFPVTGWGCM